MKRQLLLKQRLPNFGCGVKIDSEKDDDRAMLIIGRLGAPHGIQGYQRVGTFTQSPDELLGFEQVFLGSKKGWQPISFASSKVHQKGVLVRLEGVTTPEEAALYSQRYIAVLREALPTLPEGEFYWTDLEGLTVQTIEGKVFGQVHSLYRNCDIDVMIIKQGNSEQHIPFTMGDTVLSVSLDDRTIVVDWEIDL